VFDADSLSTEQMQAFANWTNLSETTFVLKPTQPEADYRLRIFTPQTEFKFAGHPTLGTCHAWLERGGRPKRANVVVQECGIGLVNVHRTSHERLAFEAPSTKIAAVEADLLAHVYIALGISPKDVVQSAWLDNGGPPWLCLQLHSAAQVLKIEPDHVALKSLAKVGLIGPYAASNECAYEVRAFAAAVGVNEDPVTGSLNASLAHWLKQMDQVPHDYVVSQGTRLGRAGRVYVSHRADGLILIGGVSQTRVSGTLMI
jgi:PhzF family phenazine biosynthesis protein